MNSEHRLALPIGSFLNQFQIEAVLGYGGFGIVYKAKHKHLVQWLAIKEYLPQEFATREGTTVVPLGTSEEETFKEGMSRFLAEAQQLVQFESHPNIVTCRDFFEANGTGYLVMNFEDGKPLSEIFKDFQYSGKSLSEEQILAIILPLLDGLKTIHDYGVLHRDIKPGNIFIRRADERPVLIDFGAAKQNYSQHSKSLAPYSIGYAAYEQVHIDGNLGPWTDLHAIGGVMWRALSGQNPKDVTTRAAALFRNKPDPMPSAKELGQGNYSDSFLEAIDRCLMIHEEDRFQDASELIEALQPGRSASNNPSSTHNITQPPPSKFSESASVINTPTPQQDDNEQQTQVAKIQTAASAKGKNSTKENASSTDKASSPPKKQLLPWVLTGVIVVAIAAVAILLIMPEGEKAGQSSNEEIVQQSDTEKDRSTAPNIPQQDTSKATKYQLWVNTTPSNAQIVVRGSNGTYRQGMQLNPGVYPIEVSANNHQTKTLSVDLRNSDQTIDVVLESLKVEHQLWVNTVPRNASIIINNGAINYTQGMKLAANQYSITVTSSGYQTKTVNADLRTQNQTLTIELEQNIATAPRPSRPSPAEALWKDCRIPGGEPLSGEAYFVLPDDLSSDQVSIKLGRFPVPLKRVTSRDEFRNACTGSNCYKARGNFGIQAFTATGRGNTQQGRACFYAVGEKPHVYSLDL